MPTTWPERSGSDETVFGWRFRPWGPPGFFLSPRATRLTRVSRDALQDRHEIVPGQRINGYECTIDVDDIDTAAAAVVANGGKIVLPKCEIPTVGWITKIAGSRRQYRVRQATGQRAFVVVADHIHCRNCYFQHYNGVRKLFMESFLTPFADIFHSPLS